jgi:hypothetical protein
MPTIKPRPRIIIRAQGVNDQDHYYDVNRELTVTGYESRYHDHYLRGERLYGVPVPDERTLALADKLRAIPGVKEVHLSSFMLGIERHGAFDWQRIDHEVIKLIKQHFGWRDKTPFGYIYKYVDDLKLLVHELKNKLGQFASLTGAVDIVRQDAPSRQKLKRSSRQCDHGVRENNEVHGRR